jgi:hypothetical protein
MVFACVINNFATTEKFNELTLKKQAELADGD